MHNNDCKQSLQRPPRLMPEASRGRVMDLRGLAWMVRHLDEPVSSVHVLPDGGSSPELERMRRWDEQGNCSGRRQRLSRDGRDAGRRAGADRWSAVVVLDLATGEERWSRPLKAALTCSAWSASPRPPPRSTTSKRDFLESAFWLHDASGEELHVHRLDERPWDVIEHDGELLFGLGRPRRPARDQGRPHLRAPCRQRRRGARDGARRGRPAQAVQRGRPAAPQRRGRGRYGAGRCDSCGRWTPLPQRRGLRLHDGGVAWSVKGAPVTAAAAEGEDGFVAVARWSCARPFGID